MLEIIVGVWIISLILSLLTVGFGFFLTYKKLNSMQLRKLNENLGLADLFWSNSLADFATLTENSIQKDAAKTLQSSLWMALLGLASLPGFIFLLILVISVHTLARSRKERATFESVLAQRVGFSKEEVLKVVEELRSI